MILPKVAPAGGRNSGASGSEYMLSRFNRHRSTDQENIDLYSLWKAKTANEGCIFKAIRNSDMFSEERKETFVKFNYRTIENKEINYEATFRKVLHTEEAEPRSKKGTMHVNELWSERNLQELMGNVPFPKDRLKILKYYQLSQRRQGAAKRVKK